MKRELDEKSRNALVQYRLQRAKDTLLEAQEIIELGFLNSSVNRLYYACYYAVIALLVKENINAQTHAGVKQMLGLHFIATNRISKESGRFYSQIFNERITGDYDDFISFDIETVNALLKNTHKFIQEINIFLLNTAK